MILDNREHRFSWGTHPLRAYPRAGRGLHHLDQLVAYNTMFFPLREVVQVPLPAGTMRF
jgi:hypothetical protein